MAKLTIYRTEVIKAHHYEMMFDLYEDFLKKAEKDYLFYVDPINLEKVFECIRERILRGILLFENDELKAFLIYSTITSSSVDINIVHMIDNENSQERLNRLIDELFYQLKDAKIKKTITFPLLGVQKQHLETLKQQNFKIVENVIMAISKSEFQKFKPCKFELTEDLSLATWENFYFDNCSILLHKCFRNQRDALYELRYRTIMGTRDLLKKVIENEYGYFLSKVSTLLLQNNKVMGLCLANLATSKIANISHVALDENLRGRKLGEMLVNETLRKLINPNLSGNVDLDEINVTTNYDNEVAKKMYIANGFEISSQYQHAYFNFI